MFHLYIHVWHLCKDFGPVKYYIRRGRVNAPPPLNLHCSYIEKIINEFSLLNNDMYTYYFPLPVFIFILLHSKFTFWHIFIMMIKSNLFFHCIINTNGVVIILRKDIISTSYNVVANKDLLYAWEQILH